MHSGCGVCGAGLLLKPAPGGGGDCLVGLLPLE